MTVVMVRDAWDKIVFRNTLQHPDIKPVKIWSPAGYHTVKTVEEILWIHEARHDYEVGDSGSYAWCEILHLEDYGLISYIDMQVEHKNLTTGEPMFGNCGCIIYLNGKPITHCTVYQNWNSTINEHLMNGIQRYLPNLFIPVQPDDEIQIRYTTMAVPASGRLVTDRVYIKIVKER